MRKRSPQVGGGRGSACLGGISRFPFCTLINVIMPSNRPGVPITLSSFFINDQKEIQERVTSNTEP